MLVVDHASVDQTKPSRRIIRLFDECCDGISDCDQRLIFDADDHESYAEDLDQIKDNHDSQERQADVEAALRFNSFAETILDGQSVYGPGTRIFSQVREVTTTHVCAGVSIVRADPVVSIRSVNPRRGNNFVGVRSDAYER